MPVRTSLGVMLGLAWAAGAARAEAPRGTVVWSDATSRLAPGPDDPLPRLLYLNRCMPDGCEISPGEDDSRNDTSSIVGGLAYLPAFTQDETTWRAVVACVKKTYAWFDIEITDVDPGPATPHFEVMFGGAATDLRNEWIPFNAGGVAPGTCWPLHNAITFVFDVFEDHVENLCYVAAQESAHALGLDHELLANDPMTYLSYSGHRDFQDQLASCGEDVPRRCWCGGEEQNSFRDIMAIFGPHAPTPPTVTITEPAAGAYVPTGFTVRAEYLDDIDVVRAEMLVDGVVLATRTAPPFSFRAPSGITEGAHTLTVRGYDPQGTAGEASIPIEVAPPCMDAAECGPGLTCVGGRCVAGPGTAGGLGEACATNAECASEWCGDDGSGLLYCVEACALDGDDCPEGFACEQAATGGGACWPVPPCAGPGGGAAGGDGDPALPIGLALGLAALVTRRRRRRAR